MTRFRTKREQTAYEEGQADGRTTRRTGEFVTTNKRPTERPNDEARAYSLGHGDGQYDQTIPDRRGSQRIQPDRRPGRPEIGPALKLRLTPTQLAEIDRRRTSADDGKPVSRAEMVRRLLDEALSPDESTRT